MQRLLLAMVSAVCLAQTQSNIKVTTRLVELNVIVRYKGGPVADLTADDFTLSDQGKPQKIAAFAKTVTPANALAAAASPLPAHVYSNRPETKGPVPANTTVVLLDALNTESVDPTVVRKRFLEFLKQIRPSDRVAVYALGSQLSLLYEYTSDASKLASAVSRYASESSSGDVVIDRWLNSGNAAFAGNTLELRAGATAAALEAIAQHVERLPGRKSLVWISATFPLSIGDMGSDSVNVIGYAINQAEYRRHLVRATHALDEAGMAVHPVDARGLNGLPASLTAAGGTAVSRGQTITGATADQSSIVSGLAVRQIIAANTGGEAFDNTNDVNGAIRKVIDEGQVSYTLFFTPEASALNGKFHTLKVQVKRPGAEVRYRRGYLALAETAPPDKERAALIRDAVASPLESLGIVLTAGVEADQPKPGATRITLAIDPKDIAFTENNGKWGATLDVAYCLLAADGHILSTAPQGLNINLPKEQYEAVMKEGMTVTRTIEAKPEVAEVRVVVFDRATGKTGSLILPPK